MRKILVASLFGSSIEWFDYFLYETVSALGYQIDAAVAGGTAPLIATYLLYKFNDSYVPVALYMILTSTLSLIAICRVERSNK